MSNQADGPFERQKLIRLQHCDPAGIVFYPQYFLLFNELVEDWFNEGLGIDFADFHANARMGIPLAHVEADFVAPSKQGEQLTMRLTVKELGNSSLKLGISALCGGEERVRAALTIVQASLDTRRSVPFSPETRARIERFRS
jgi:4-hydroxybenzoyl-CoA thioesterase